MKLEAMLEELVKAPGVSGSEGQAAEVAAKLLKECGAFDVRVENGSVIGSAGREKGHPHILLDAHMDQVGMVVTSLKEGGFLTVASCGGIDARLLPGQRLMVHGEESIPAVVCSTPPHLAANDGKIPEITELFLDTGLSLEKLEKIVSLGDTVTFDTPMETLVNKRAAGPGMDNKASVAAVLYAVSKLKKDLDCRVTVLFSSQEEVGARGAKVHAFSEKPDMALVLDVTFGKAPKDNSKFPMNIGGGPAIGLAPTLSRELGDKLAKLAKKQEIPIQYEVMGGGTGTNADDISTTRNGIPTVTLSVPLAYMHTPIEMVDLEDIRNTGLLIGAFLESIRKD